MTRAASPLASAATAVLVLLLAPCAIQAQTPEPRFEASAGGLFLGGYSLGSADAELVANQIGGGPYTLFTSDTRVDGSSGFESRVGVRLSSLFLVEGGVLLSRPKMVSRLSGDVENAPPTSARQDTSLYIFDGALVARFGTGRLRPFVRVGAGYVRELHEDNLLVETGTAFHAGGGATFWLSQARRRIGVRGDARVYVIRDGLSSGDGNRTLGSGGGAVVFAF